MTYCQHSEILIECMPGELHVKYVSFAILNFGEPLILAESMCCGSYNSWLFFTLPIKSRWFAMLYMEMNYA